MGRSSTCTAFLSRGFQKQPSYNRADWWFNCVMIIARFDTMEFRTQLVQSAWPKNPIEVDRYLRTKGLLLNRDKNMRTERTKMYLHEIWL